MLRKIQANNKSWTNVAETPRAPGLRSISSSGQYVTCKNISQIQVQLFTFSNPTHKTKTGTEIGGRLLIATHLDQSNYLTNQHEMLCLAVPFTSLIKLCTNAGPKPFCWAKLTCSDFSSSEFNLQGHILSTAGVALRHLWKCSYCSKLSWDIISMEGGVFDILGKGLQEIQHDNYMILSTSISLIGLQEIQQDNYMTLSTRICYTLLEEDLNSE